MNGVTVIPRSRLETRAERLAVLEGRIERAMGARRYVPRGGKVVGPTDVYRCYDASGCLLYVGISLTVAQRMGQHRSNPWWPLVSRIEVEHHPDRDTARTREQELIWDLAPLYNRAGRR